MKTTRTQSTLGRLAAIAVGVGMSLGAADAAGEIPQDDLEELLASDDMNDVPVCDRWKMLHTLAHDQRRTVRELTLDGVVSFATVNPALTSRLLMNFAEDPDPAVRARVAEQALPAALRAMNGLDRTALLSEWAQSTDRVRFTLASALPALPPAVGLRTVAEHLRADSNAIVAWSASLRA